MKHTALPEATTESASPWINNIGGVRFDMWCSGDKACTNLPMPSPHRLVRSMVTC
ncbi:MAG: hypothetical protein ABSH34_07745 [Verrucomicrobiota bacterium]